MGATACATIARQSARNSLVLIVGNLLSTAIAAAAIIVIARLLGPEQYGIYTLTWVIPNILQLSAGLGIGQAVSRFSAFHLARGDPEAAARYSVAAIVFLSLLGIALATLDFGGAGYFSTAILHRPGLTPYVQLASLFVLGQTLLQVASSALVGWNMAGSASVTNVLQSSLKLILSVGLIIVGLGVYGAALGQVASYLSAGIFGVLLVWTKLRLGRRALVGLVSEIRGMLSYGLPLFGASLVYGLALQLLTIILASVASNATIGYYQAAANVTVAISTISTGFSTSLFRGFASLSGAKGDIRLAFTLAVKYLSFLVTPMVVFVAATSGLELSLLYGSS